MAEPKVALINSFVVEWWDIERPKDYPLNARKWKPAAVAKLIGGDAVLQVLENIEV